MRVRVKTLTRRTFGMDVHPSASIEELKARVTQETGIPLTGQRLVYKGEVLDGGCVQVSVSFRRKGRLMENRDERHAYLIHISNRE